jgi:hypothetical protein
MLPTTGSDVSFPLGIITDAEVRHKRSYFNYIAK